jgi:hypothetical protein
MMFSTISLIETVQSTYFVQITSSHVPTRGGEIISLMFGTECIVLWLTGIIGRVSKTLQLRTLDDGHSCSTIENRCQ